MTELILIRHGETAWNAERRLQGHIDIDLNTEGERQAAALGRAFVAEPVDCIVSSDLGRAARTAQAIADAKGMRIEFTEILRERCYGGLEGLQYDEIRDQHPTVWQQWQARDVDARYPAGIRQAETLREFSARVQKALDWVAGQWPGRRIAVVTHGGVLDCAYRLVTGMALDGARNFDVRNASINRIQWGATSKILAWGEVDHLSASLDEIDR